MIVFLWVDYCLLYGQVVFFWMQYVGVDCILIVNDSVFNDDLCKIIIKMVKLFVVKLVIKNIVDLIEVIKSGVIDKYKFFIVVEFVVDVYWLVCELFDIKSINLGGMKVCEGSQNIVKVINLLVDEMI